MSTPATVRLIAGREIRERLEGRFLRVMTVITALLVVAGVTIPALVHSDKATKLGLVGPATHALAPPLQRTAQAARLRIALVSVADDARARALLRSGGLDAALSLSGAGARLEAKQSVPGDVTEVVSATLDALHIRSALLGAGVGPAAVTRALTPVKVTAASIQPARSHEGARNLAAFAVGLLMYLSLVIYGAAVAQGVAQEKTSRTAEILLSAVRPSELLAGKVAGIGVVGLGQLAVAAGAGLIANAAVHSTRIPGVVWVLIPAFLVYFLAGFALYAFLFAAAGALVARQEEVQFVTMPFSIVLVGGYLLVYAVIGSPDATWIHVLAFVPLLTPQLAPALIAVGHIPVWEVVAQAVVLLGTIYLTARVASRIYAAALVRGGARISWSAALRLHPARSQTIS
jgi:ABC-2 type transport system permease protein